MATPTDLWGDLETLGLTQRTPLSILREQAALLGEKTHNLVEAQVDSSTYDGEFMLTLNLVVPSLDDYTYRLLQVSHRVTLYPVTVMSDRVELKNEEAFVNWLRTKLSSPETRRIIGNLLSQASS